MSDRTYWFIMAGWTLCVVGMVLWMWFEIKRSDERYDLEQVRQAEVDAGWEEWLDEMAEKRPPVFDLPRGQELNFQDRSRKAESLGFQDDEYPHFPRAS